MTHVAKIADSLRAIEAANPEAVKRVVLNQLLVFSSTAATECLDGEQGAHLHSVFRCSSKEEVTVKQAATLAAVMILGGSRK